MKKIMTGSVILAVVTLFIFAGIGFADDSLHVHSNGKVGIGIDLPLAKLHVAEGEVRFERGTGEDPTSFYDDDKKNHIQGDTIFSNKIGIGINNPGWPLTVWGYAVAHNWLKWSDGDLKQDIQPLENGLDRLSRLRGVRYKLKDEPEETKREHVGVIAQEVEQEFPELVFTDKNGYKAVDYGGLIAPLIESVKELKAKNKSNRIRIKDLEDKNTVLEKRIAALEKAISKEK
jgi:hypothetical protein